MPNHYIRRNGTRVVDVERVERSKGGNISLTLSEAADTDGQPYHLVTVADDGTETVERFRFGQVIRHKAFGSLLPNEEPDTGSPITTNDLPTNPLDRQVKPKKDLGLGSGREPANDPKLRKAKGASRKRPRIGK